MSCNKYCHGRGGLSMNNELPISWSGAQCVIGGVNGDIPCNQVGKDPNSTTNKLPCLCQRNDNFPYDTRQNVGTTADVISPALAESAFVLTAMRDTIVQETTDVNNLINSILLKQGVNRSTMDSNVAPFLHQLQALSVDFAEVERLAAIPEEFNANFEATKLTSTSNFNRYMLYFLFAAFVIGCLIYITNNPESGSLDMFILALAIFILAYYVYEYVQLKKRSM